MTLWTGFAAIAINDGVYPGALQALKFSAQPPAEPEAKLLLFPVIANNLSQDGLKSAFEVNIRIFADLYWVHLAYTDGGIKLLERLKDDNVLSKDIFDGFKMIDDGRKLLVRDKKEGRQLIADGNKALFRHEQEFSATPPFEKYHEALWVATQRDLIRIPNRELRNRAKEPKWPYEKKSYGPFQPRWDWLEGNGWKPYVEFSRDNPRGLVNEIDRAIKGNGEGK
jgi:hypothetical protein